MSPIVNESSLDLQDTNHDAELFSLISSSSAPKVLADKIPHPTDLDSFGPPQLQRKDSIHYRDKNQWNSFQNTMFMQREDLPTAYTKELPHGGAELGPPVLLTESVIPERNVFMHNLCHNQQQHTSNDIFKRKGKEDRKQRGLDNQAAKRTTSVSNKSYDHEVSSSIKFTTYCMRVYFFGYI